MSYNKFSIADLDALGDPTDYDNNRGSYINEMFISQEDSKQDSFSPQNSQALGQEHYKLPNDSDKNNKSKSSKKIDNIAEKMNILTDEIKKLK
jgi:hypothetical protein